MSSLFQIRQDHYSLLSLIEQNEGVLSEEELQAFQLNQDDFESKAISYAYIIKKFQAESDTIKNEMDRLAKLKKTADNAADRFKKSLQDAMEQFKVDKISGDTIKIGFMKSTPLEIEQELQERIEKQVSAKLSIVYPEDIPGNESMIDPTLLDYMKVSIAIDKTALNNAVQKEGLEIKGVSAPEKKNLQIR